MLSLYPLWASLFLWVGVRATCECGYKTNTGDIWQYAITTDFTTLTTAQFADSSDWRIDTTFRENGTSNPYAVNYTTANLAVQSNYLELTCSKYDSSSNDYVINSAEIATQRYDIKYGSFRSRHMVKGGSGAIGALFFYANDTEEIDIEVLTRDNARDIHFTNQPDGILEVYMPNDLKRTALADYRFDWLPSVTRFYVDNVSSGNITEDVASINGSIKMNSWANGGSFSGPDVPTSDSVMSVQYIDLYFNTSDTAKAASWKETCNSAAVAACSVDTAIISSNTTSSSTSNLTQRSTAARPKIGFPITY